MTVGHGPRDGRDPITDFITRYPCTVIYATVCIILISVLALVA